MSTLSQYRTISFLLLFSACGSAQAGVVCLDGLPGCFFNDGDYVRVGSNGEGNGSLLIDGSSEFNAPNEAAIGAWGTDNGTVLVTGSGTRLDTGGGTNSILFVGEEGGTGTLTVTDNATVTSNAFENHFGFGDARILIGDGGSGTVNVTSGGTLVAQDLVGYGTEDGILIGSATNNRPGTGTVNADGPGSSVVVEGNYAFITVGSANNDYAGPYSASGFLNVTNKAKVLIDGTTSSGLLSVGNGGQTNGTVRVSGADSLIDITGTTSYLIVANDFSNATGTDGSGSVVITDNGRVTVGSEQHAGTGHAFIGIGLGDGSVTVDQGGLLDVDGTIDVSFNSETHNSQTGTLLVNGTGTVKADRIYVGNNDDSAISGILGGTGTVVGDVFIEAGGSLAPGNSPGTLTIVGNLSADAGTLAIEVAGLGVGEHDFLNVEGTVDLTNALIEFIFIDDFLPRAGDLLPFLSADQILGLTEASFKYSGLADGFEFNVSGVDDKLIFLALNDGVAAVPESGTLVLLGLGLAGLGAVRRKKLAA